MLFFRYDLYSCFSCCYVIKFFWEVSKQRLQVSIFTFNMKKASFKAFSFLLSSRSYNLCNCSDHIHFLFVSTQLVWTDSEESCPCPMLVEN